MSSDWWIGAQLELFYDEPNLNALNKMIELHLKDTLDDVQPPFFLFEDGTLHVLPVRTSHIFSGGLEQRVDS